MLGGLLVILVYFLPYFILGEDCHVQIHDNLDANLIWIKLALEHGGIFSHPTAQIPAILNGVPRSSVVVTYDISLIAFKFLGMYWGYVLNKLIMSIVAFFGMRKLLSEYLGGSFQELLIQVLVALIFALLPFWSFALNVAGIPLLLFIFLRLRKGELPTIYWSYIVIYGLYSSLVLVGFFLFIVLGLILVHDSIKNQTINWKYVFGLILLGVSYLISHIPLFYLFLIDTGIESHRVEMKFPKLNLISSLDAAKTLFLNGQYHAHSLHNNIAYPIIILALLSVYWNRHKKVIFYSLFFILLTSLLYGFLSYQGFASGVNALMSIVPIQLQRFHFLHPVVWYVLLGIGLGVLVSKRSWGIYLAVGILLIQLVHVVKYHEHVVNKNGPSFREFFAEEQFKELKENITEPLNDVKVISVGLHPAVSQYNGLYTLDGYLPSYPLVYKHSFREVIKEELNKEELLRLYFDNWGSRCYAFSSEIGKSFANPDIEPIHKLDYDYVAFKKMGGAYIISATIIQEDENLRLLAQSDHNDNFWKLYLYKVR